MVSQQNRAGSLRPLINMADALGLQLIRISECFTVIKPFQQGLSDESFVNVQIRLLIYQESAIQNSVISFVVREAEKKGGVKNFQQF